MPRKVTYPIVEMFSSIQGEGEYVGTTMFFIRFGGCPVGKVKGECLTFNGVKFDCDTKYQQFDKKTIPQITSSIPAGTKYVCLTGGEPFLYNLNPLISRLLLKGMSIHIETSGTIKPKRFLWSRVNWITVSPKAGCDFDFWDKHCSSYKFLIDYKTKGLFLEDFKNNGVVFLQPIKDKNYKRNLNKALGLCHIYNVRLSLQMHKYIGAR